MLNELLTLHRGAKQAGVEMEIRHPDIKDSRKIPTFVIGLSKTGNVAEISLKPAGLTPWTLRDGMHNSFPFVQVKPPLMGHQLDFDDELIEKVLDRRNDGRRKDFLKWFAEATPNTDALQEWPGDGLLNRLATRLEETGELTKGKAEVVPFSIDRFKIACDTLSGAGLLGLVGEKLMRELKKNPDSEFLEAAICLMLGKYNKSNTAWENAGGVIFEAAGCKTSIIDPRVVPLLSKCLNSNEAKSTDSSQGICALSGGKATSIIDDKFPQPNIPLLGQTYLYSKNDAAKANLRYGHSSVESMPVGIDLANSLSAAFSAITDSDRLMKTWRPIPGEAPKQTDLLLAYVLADPNIPIASVVVDVDDDDDDEDEEAREDRLANSIAEYENRTERILDAVKAKVGEDFRRTPVVFNVFRKVDPANRKVVYGGSRSIGDLHQAATEWCEGERNLPNLELLAKPAGKGKANRISPPHVSPLGMISFSKKSFRRGGIESQDVTGIPASEAMAFFLEPRDSGGVELYRRAHRLLRMVLRYRFQMCSNAVQLMRKHDLRMVDDANYEALRTVSVLGILLFKLGRTKEIYMKETAFQLGQLLAGADVVHAGYCLDVRGGSLPPSLLGNQIFAMAQTSPTQALSMWAKRWKPYEGWARRLQHSEKDQTRIEALKNSKGKADQQKGWDIKKALRNWRDMKPIAECLSGTLEECTVDDAFRVELLLGYMAGIPATKKEEA